jgi:DNA-binding SARP family transcriptional activator/TolB-like protein/Tfp pilus assembly protein PilF
MSRQDVFELRTLGSLDLRTSQGQELRSVLAQGKRMALLCYLAAARPPGFHRRDNLIALFWPEVDEQHGRAALRQALHFLRQSLGPDVVLSRGPEEVGLDFERLSCDVVRFRQCIERGETETAVELYQGPLLSGVYVSDAPEFERWVGSERERLASLFADALQSLANVAAEQGDYARAAQWLRRLADHDPCSSQVARQLMMMLTACGDPAAAMMHAQAHAQAVREHLEAEPAAEILDLAQQLRQEPQRGTTSLPDGAAWRFPTPANGVPTTAGARLPARATRWRRVAYAAAAVLVALTSVAVYSVAQRRGSGVTPGNVSVAVLPFENLGSAADDYFAAGLADDLANRLAGVHDLSIVNPSGSGFDAPEQLERYSSVEFGAQFTLRASVERVRRAGTPQQLRVIPSLIRVADGVQVWTDAFDVDPLRLFDVQARIAEQVSGQLGIRTLSTEREWLRAAPTSNLEAYDLYLRANEALRAGVQSAEAMRTAVAFAERAAELDPGFVQAHARLAIAHTSMYWWNHDRSPERLAAAKAAADRAIQLGPDRPMSHLALGWYYYWGLRDYNRALRHFELARANWPGASDVLVLVGGIRRRQGDFEQALANHHEALSANPACATCAAEAAVTYLMLRDFAAAEREATRALAVGPDLAYARSVAALTQLSARGDTAAAREMLEPAASGQSLVYLAAGMWGAIPRILGGEYDQGIADLCLSPEITDTAGYFLIKADLAARTLQPRLARTYYDSARVALERGVARLRHDPQLHSRLGVAYAGMGRTDDAVHEGIEATRLRPVADDAVDGTVACEALARIYAMLGEQDAAIDRLELLLSVPSLLSRQLLQLDPVWSTLREHPRFERLVH